MISQKPINSKRKKKAPVKDESNIPPSVSPRPLSFSDFEEHEKPKPVRVFIEPLGGHVYILPTPGQIMYKLSRIENVIEAIHEMSVYLSTKVFSDEDARKPVATYDNWMSLSPGQIIGVFNLLRDALRLGGEEKNV